MRLLSSFLFNDVRLLFLSASAKKTQDMLETKSPDNTSLIPLIHQPSASHTLPAITHKHGYMEQDKNLDRNSLSCSGSKCRILLESTAKLHSTFSFISKENLQQAAWISSLTKINKKTRQTQEPSNPRFLIWKQHLFSLLCSNKVV